MCVTMGEEEMPDIFISLSEVLIKDSTKISIKPLKGD